MSKTGWMYDKCFLLEKTLCEKMLKYDWLGADLCEKMLKSDRLGAIH